MSRVRSLVSPISVVIPLAFVCGFVLLIETMAHLGYNESHVIVPHASCIGRQLEPQTTTVELLLECGSRKATTTAPATLVKYAADTAFVFTCDIHRSGTADCTAKGPAKTQSRELTNSRGGT